MEAAKTPRDPDRNAGLSLPYRIGWRLQYMLLHVYGPAQLAGGNDPRSRLRRDRERRVERELARRRGEGRPEDSTDD